MTWAMQFLGLLMLALGVGFVIAAAIGVLRFPDALQRMHASTKAGTLGAIFAVLGAMILLGEGTAAIGSMAIVFMLLTVPVAAHLLGRAAYVSGAPLRLIAGRNALLGVLERQDVPLEARTQFVAYSPLSSRRETASVAPEVIADLSEVRLGVMAPDIAPALRRAIAIRNLAKVPLKAIAVIDEAFLQATSDPQRARSKVREKLSLAIEELEATLPKKRSFFTLSYEEGDPLKLIPTGSDRASLLILPSHGWCHHGVDLPTPGATGRPEGLLKLPDHHAGSVLFVHRDTVPRSPTILIEDDGSLEIAEGLDWALRTRIWVAPRLVLINRGGLARRDVFAVIAERHGATLDDRLLDAAPNAPLPAGGADADALVTTTLPSPKRADWYGQSWHDRLAPNWTGDVLVVPSTPKAG
ncbi:monovalent cation/H(+) antiporter subunit G [Devosia chinhatensis]|uniref:monovalent cation/H(+) antiporter subunit G n=1 Tax=Devosia chinhatensis TaxID=429727 RepID=UPI000A94ACD4|nr:monovalent cation/H(+) antiporter subunit G [Devosia chinhatensis]